MEQTLGDCFWEGAGTEGGVGEEGYFTTVGAGCWIQPYRLRGWDYSVGRKWSSIGVFVGVDSRVGARVPGAVEVIRSLLGIGPAGIVTSLVAGMHAAPVTGVGLPGIGIKAVQGKGILEVGTWVAGTREV